MMLALILGDGLLLSLGRKAAMALRKCQSLAGFFRLASSGFSNWIAWASTVLLGFVLVVGSGTARAQDIFGRIAGTVTDSSGGTVPEVKLTIENEATKAEREISTDKN